MPAVPDYCMAGLLLHVFHRNPLEYIHRHVGKVGVECSICLSLGGAQQRLFSPLRLSHYHVVEQTGRPLDDIEVAVSRGSKLPGINDRFQGRGLYRCTLKKEPGQLPGF
ncbi:MAG: hypothetical protein CM1200mP29_14350 [Verrucomicrobiota bacterium]|nr:MAG: hypothetical protein CM1200mP29_14350 [Verrucomicrobiota bacterium]